MDPVVHFEMPAKDMQRARAFYEKVFGWTVLPAYDTYYLATTTPGDAGQMSQTPGEINGAIQQKDESIQTTRLIVKVSDIDKALEKALAEGGRVFIPKKKLPTMLYSVIWDTEGNEVNIVQPLE
jgi:predicted enzyme related to lactoylglutathione lyase